MLIKHASAILKEVSDSDSDSDSDSKGSWPKHLSQGLVNDALRTIEKAASATEVDKERAINIRKILSRR